MKQAFYEAIIKRPMDFILSLLAIILLSPIIILLQFTAKVNNPILFQNPGKKQKFSKGPNISLP